MYTAIICKLKTTPIPNAKAIQKANCNGYTAIVSNQHKNGDLGIFFPHDGQIAKAMVEKNNLLADGYLKNNRRVRTIKLMKIESEGLWLPISSLKWTEDSTNEWRESKNSINLKKKISELKEGDIFSALNGNHICNKFITKATREKSQSKIVTPTLWVKIKKLYKHLLNNDYSYFQRHFETEKIQHIICNRDIKIAYETECYISTKLHGTSQRTGLVKFASPLRTLLEGVGLLNPKYEYQLGTRNVIFTKNRKCRDIYRINAHDILKRKLRKGETIYYEIVGYTENNKSIMSPHRIEDKKISKKFKDPMYYSYLMEPCNDDNPKYGKNFDIYIYRITQQKEKEIHNLSPFELMIRCNDLGIKQAPFVDMTTWTDNAEDFLNYCKRASEIDGIASHIDNSHIDEGICIRFYNVNTVPVTDITVKYKSWLFCDCEGIAKNSDSYIDSEEIDEEIITE